MKLQRIYNEYTYNSDLPFTKNWKRQRKLGQGITECKREKFHLLYIDKNCYFYWSGTNIGSVYGLGNTRSAIKEVPRGHPWLRENPCPPTRIWDPLEFYFWTPCTIVFFISLFLGFPAIWSGFPLATNTAVSEMKFLFLDTIQTKDDPDPDLTR